MIKETESKLSILMNVGNMNQSNENLSPKIIMAINVIVDNFLLLLFQRAILFFLSVFFFVLFCFVLLESLVRTSKETEVKHWAVFSPEYFVKIQIVLMTYLLRTCVIINPGIYPQNFRNTNKTLL